MILMTGHPNGASRCIAAGVATVSDRRRKRRKPVKIAPKPKPKEREERPTAGLQRWLRGAALTMTMEMKP